jgi:glycosyltransferase involved in cell wall biosynthesis
MSAERERHLWVWYSPYGIGGVETYLLNMARETIDDGGAVWVAATKSAVGPLRDLFLKAGVQLLDWSTFHDAFMNKQSAEPIRHRMIADLARVQPTLLALNDCNELSMGAAPLLRRLRQYCTILDTLHIDSPIDQYLDFRRTFLDVLDGIAATNQNVIHRFRRSYPNAGDLEVRYIANGVTVLERERKPAGETLRLLYVGRLAQDQKRILDLPPLLERLKALGKAFTMTIAGDGPCREELAGDIARLGLNDRVRLTGYLSPQQVADLYFEHDVLVNLSTFEGFSMSVLEAFAAGCVPVCTEVASLDRSVFQDGVNCRLCPVGELDQMVDIWSALTPPSLRQLSVAAKTTGLRFTTNKTYLEYRELLASLRERRPLEPWPADAASVLGLDWDLSRHNPWLPRPHPLREFGRSTWRRVRKALNNVRQ